MIVNLFIVTFSIVLLLNYISKKNSFLLSLTNDKHQLFVSKKNIPLTGGLAIILVSIFVFNFDLKILHLFFSLVFAIGFLSDINQLRSAKIRFFLQTASILLFVVYYDISLSEVKVFFIDYFIKYKLLSYFFTSFCLLIVFNGTNFIDGLNGLVIGYYSIIIYILINSNIYENNLFINDILIKYLIVFLCLLFFNLFDKLYLGDSGSYLVGSSIGIFLIFTFVNYENISPFFIVLLLWYPSFENLFSIIRKFKFNSSPLNADNKHFHQLFYNYIKKKYKLSSLSANNFSSFIINLFNLIIFTLGSKNIYSSRLQISLIFLSVLLYGYLYFKLFNFRYSFKK